MTYLRRIYQKFKIFTYRKKQRNEANNAYKILNEKIDKIELNRCKEYSKDVLGWEGYYPWLVVYTVINGRFKEGWIPDDYYGSIVIPKIKGRYGRISEMKSLNTLVFNSYDFPDLVYCMNGTWYDLKYDKVSLDRAKELIFKNTDVAVFKMNFTSKGNGILMLNENNFKKYFSKNIIDGVVQKFIKQNNYFSKFKSQSVATIRVTTVVNNKNQVSVRACYLRLGRKEDSHVKSQTHIRVPINVAEGMLNEVGYLPNWKKIYKHPDSEIIFKSESIPNFKKIIETAVDLHKKVSFLSPIGWDMTIDMDGNVHVMEWNGMHNDIKFSEATQGPCFSDLGWENLWKD